MFQKSYERFHSVLFLSRKEVLKILLVRSLKSADTAYGPFQEFLPSARSLADFLLLQSHLLDIILHTETVVSFCLLVCSFAYRMDFFQSCTAFCDAKIRIPLSSLSHLWQNHFSAYPVFDKNHLAHRIKQNRFHQK